MERRAIANDQKMPTANNHPQKQFARSSSVAHSLLELQRSIGNQAVERLINSPYIQTRRRVSTPGDPYKQEADRVADTVMRPPDELTSRRPDNRANSRNVRSNSLSIQRWEWLDQTVAVGPYDMVQAALAANEAKFEAEHSMLPGFSDGPQDAFRHAYWSCLLALDIGAAQAKAVGDTHEDQAPDVSPMITLMDQHNNAIGRLLARQAKSRSDVKGLVWGALRRGNLLIIENWRARSDARKAGQKPPAAGPTVMSNIDQDDLDTSIKPLPAGKLDWVKSKTEYRIAREKEMVALLKRPIRAGDVKANESRNNELVKVTKDAADPYWSGYYRDRFEANRADDELVTLLKRKLSNRLAGQIKDMLTYADAGKKDKTKKKK